MVDALQIGIVPVVHSMLVSIITQSQGARAERMTVSFCSIPRAR